MMKVALFLSTVGLAIAGVPSYIPVCGRKNPDLDNCVTNSIEMLRGKLREGMPDLEAPAIEPLAIKYMKLADEESFKAVAENIQLYGLPDFAVKSLHVDLKKQEIDGNVVFDKIKMTADYNVSTKVVVPITGSGPIHVVADGVKAQFNLKFKIINNKGKQYFFFPSMTIKLAIEDYTSHFEQRNGESNTLAVAINSALEGSRQEIIKLITPYLEAAISSEVLKLSNIICKHITYDEALPDHE